MKFCKTCKWWTAPNPKENWNATQICTPLDPDTFEPMKARFETRVCKQPTQTLFESPVAINSFALSDASEYYAVLATAEEFGCVLHEEKQ